MTGTMTRTQKVFFALGTANSITAYDSSAGSAIEEAKERVLSLHSMLNAFDEKSEISRINQNAGERPVKVSDETYRLIEDSVKFSVLTDGLFDISSRPLSQLWKKTIKEGQLPKGFDIIKAAMLCDYKDIILDSDEHTVMLRKRGQQLDLGAIAKGYAADEVKRILSEYGVANAVINLGGSVINMGEMRKIGLQNPFENTGKPFAYLTLGDKSVVSSGLYEQGTEINGKLYHHIINPKTGFPSNTEVIGVTLIGASCERLDALATVALIMKIEDAVRLLKSFNIEAVIVTKDKKILSTEGLRNDLVILKED